MPRALHSVRKSQQGISVLLWALGCWQCPYEHGRIRATAVPERRRASSLAFTSPVYSRFSAKKARKAAEVIAQGEEEVGVPDDEATSFSTELKQGIAQTLSEKRPLSDGDLVTADFPAPGSLLYGKWRSLSLDHDRLLAESDINVSDSQLVRLVDQRENESDIELWSCLLEFCHRWMGRDGVVMIWQAIFKRRNLYQVDGVLPEAFWGTILNAAVSSESFLRDVISYAEWLLEEHGARWPCLYEKVMTFMLTERPKAQALRWHMILMPSFGPGETEFVELLKRFITNPDPRLQETLQSLYTWSAHRKLYDILIPFLFDKGNSKLALPWRRLLIVHNDTPASLAARPFLRYVGAYYPNARLSEEELSVAGLALEDKEGFKSASTTEYQPAEGAINGQNLSYLINRVHGETFGIREKPYNDKLGAKWFASTWVPLDFALNVIYTIGINGIGPLSLHSIALREGNAQGVLHRMDQLRQLRINLPDSNYVGAIRHYATIGDDEALTELLHCDVHPDIFDDDVAQQELLRNCLDAGDWDTYHLLLKTRLAVTAGTIGTCSDNVLQSCARQGNGTMTLKVLQELSSHNLQPAPMTSHTISSLILQSLSPHATGHGRHHVDLQVSLCRQLAKTRFPPAVEVWQTLLYRLGREHRLIDLERLSFDVLRLFSDYASSERPMWISHMADVPQILRFESPYQHFQKLPRDLPLRHERHPLRQIFDENLMASIVRWGFLYTRYDREAESAAAAVLHGEEGDAMMDPANFHFARGIRLLAMLRDLGLQVPLMTVRKQATMRLVDLYRGGGERSYEWVGGNSALTSLRSRNMLSLPEARRLCDEAWGSEVTPGLFELMGAIEKAMREDQMSNVQKRLRAIEEGVPPTRRGR
ncbi:hypothetical protein VPNG_02356 [Cytospora leucostoma]|uniref:Pentatricopeptide repeat domain-containing protein n=1 Tax=Cytospora leucostoma TaxID=1230097 RepID=A0A423XGF8_9PEZI|nr:hypothetical protein VPNG_02356 [Cytospora leucostoma]